MERLFAVAEGTRNAEVVKPITWGWGWPNAVIEEVASFAIGRQIKESQRVHGLRKHLSTREKRYLGKRH